MKLLKQIFIILLCILLISLVSAIDQVPFGDFNGMNLYSIKNFTTINGTKLFQNGNQVMDVAGGLNFTSLNVTNNLTVGDTTTTTNLLATNLESNLDGTGFNITASWLLANIDSGRVKNPPTTCSAFAAIKNFSQNFSTSTCQDAWIHRIDGDSGTGNLTWGGTLFGIDDTNDRVNIDDYIYHYGDTNSFFGFDGADQWLLTSGGRTFINILESTNPDRIDICDSSGFCDVNMSGGLLFVDDSASSVGIGTTTPNTKLEVAGTVNITSSGSDYLIVGDFSIDSDNNVNVGDNNVTGVDCIHFTSGGMICSG